MGSANISPRTPIEAGSFASVTLTYTAGFFGIDDTGGIKICWRSQSDVARPQFSNPAAPNYVSVEASNGAVLDIQYEPKRNIRPWGRTFFIRVVRGFLREGDRIIVRFGDIRHGSAGMRWQTFHEPTFEFRVLVDAFATYDFVPLPESPEVAVVAGPPAVWKAVVPTMRGRGDRFSLFFKGEDKWGNPSNRVDGTFHVNCDSAVAGLPESFVMKPGQFATELSGLSAPDCGVLRFEVFDQEGNGLCTSNPLRIVEKPSLLPYWGDLHGQSEETIGTNSARDFFIFARDRAFLDVCCHQGNDFQITRAFWEELNKLTREFTEDGRFITFPGYEWSGNTNLGGDRNIFYSKEGRPIYRSSHALVEDHSDIESDANSAGELFERLTREDCVVFAHIGGRYADIKLSHDARLERSVEIHSDWGTFEWLLQDAFEQGYRVGIVCNSDGHLGRSGASYPGAHLFGAYGGLTCMLAEGLTRPAIMESLRKRHHYGTTGCRLILDVQATFDTPAELFSDDPGLGLTTSAAVDKAIMGDILKTRDDEITFLVEVTAPASIERIEIRNSTKTLETFRPYGANDLSRRIRVIWEGSEYRGRGRQTIWDGSASLRGNSFEQVRPINQWNLDKRLKKKAPNELVWEALTTGGFGGFDALLADPDAGTLKIETALVQCEIKISDIGQDDLVFDAGGIKRRIRVFRLPDENHCRSLRISRRVRLNRNADNALYVCVTTEDGHLSWSSPIYLIQ